MLTFKSNSNSINWKNPFAKRDNLLKLSGSAISKDAVEYFMKLSNKDDFRRKFRPFIVKSFETIKSTKEANDLKAVLTAVSLDVTDFSHLVDTKVYNSVIALLNTVVTEVTEVKK